MVQQQKKIEKLQKAVAFRLHRLTKWGENNFLFNFSPKFGEREER